VNIDNKWVKACQTNIPSVPKGQVLTVTLRPPSKEDKKAAFFTPKSLVDGFNNNVLGMVGFASTASKVDESFDSRMKREAELAAKVASLKTKKN
jgi:hypothetical protein